MPKYLVALLALFLCGQAARAFGPTNVTLDDLQSHYRVLLIFPGNRDPEPIVRSLEQARDAIRSRGVVWFILGSSLIANGPYSFNRSYRTRLLHRYDSSGGKQSLVLIGRDGSIKLHERGSLNLKHAFQLIDEMNADALPVKAGP